MELMPGYKPSDVGAIPEDWDVLPLGKLVRSVEYGSAAKSYVKGAVPVLRMGNLQGGKIDWSDLVYSDDIDEINKYTLQPGDVLFNRTNTIDLVGKTSIYEGDCPAIFAGYLIRINVVPELLDSRFLNYILNTEFSRKYSAKVLSVAVGQANINGQKLKTYPIPLPPTKSEQDAIATALSDTDALIVALDQVIAKKSDLKQAAMQQLLSGKTRLPGFSGEWMVKLVKDFGDIVTGGTPSTEKKEFWGEGYPWITPTDISTERDIITSERTITHEGLRAIRLLPANTVLVTCIASIGKNAILRSVGGCNQQINAIIPNDDNYAEFLYFLMEANKQYLLSNAGTTATAILSKAAFSEMEFLVPAKPEQIAIAEVLSGMDAELIALKSRRDKTHNLKQAMMQELLTGKTRLV
ncbi:restriction endonuclease subunit S [Vibrio fluvialis]|nr:restriction endonuclease subunit S [Vibrio cholerae]